MWLRSHVRGLLAHQRAGDGSAERGWRVVACSPVDIQVRGSMRIRLWLLLCCSCTSGGCFCHEGAWLCITAVLICCESQDIQLLPERAQLLLAVQDGQWRNEGAAMRALLGCQVFGQIPSCCRQ